MLYGIQATPMRGLGKPARRFTATTWLQILSPLIGGLLGGAAFVFSAAGRDTLGQMLLASWALLTSIGSAAMALNAATHDEI